MILDIIWTSCWINDIYSINQTLKITVVDAQSNWSISADSVDAFELWYTWKAVYLHITFSSVSKWSLSSLTIFKKRLRIPIPLWECKNLCIYINQAILLWKLQLINQLTIVSDIYRSSAGTKYLLNPCNQWLLFVTFRQ